MSIYTSPAPLQEAQRDIAAGHSWAADIRTERARSQFDAKDLFDCLGDDEDRLMALCQALLPLVIARPKVLPRVPRGIAEALQAITDPVIKERAA